MSNILHYLETDGNGEYIVITDEELSDAILDGFAKSGYYLGGTYPIESTGSLPTERSLSAD